MHLEEILKSDRFEEKEETCPGCQNHCQVRVYSNEDTTAHKGINMFEEKYKMLFAFDNRFAKVDTAPLNRQATDVSALPTGRTIVSARRGLQ